jgi:protein TonB
MTIDTEKPNLLLWGLIFISIGVHLVLLMHVAGLYRSGSPVYIELDLRNISKPIQRIIPRPQVFHDSKITHKVLEPLRIPIENQFREEPPTVLPVQKPLLRQLPKPMQAPDLPGVKSIDIATWKAETDRSESPQKQVHAPREADISSEAAYMQLLNERKIPLIQAEAQRRYDKKARKRQIQGRTVVAVKIDRNGDIMGSHIEESSKYSTLDRIALKAVENASPFPKPPHAPISLYIPINFKLI